MVKYELSVTDVELMETCLTQRSCINCQSRVGCPVREIFYNDSLYNSKKESKAISFSRDDLYGTIITLNQMCNILESKHYNELRLYPYHYSFD